MKRIRYFLTSGFLSAAFSVLSAAPVALTDLVDGRAFGVVEVSDAAALRVALADSAWGRAWADPGIAAFLAPLRRQIDDGAFTRALTGKMGAELSELVELLPGRILLALPSTGWESIATRADMDQPGKAGPVLIAAEVGDRGARVEELLLEAVARDEGNAVDETEDYGGVTLHRTGEPDSEDRLFWAIHRGVLLAGPNRGALLTALDALLDGGLADPLTRSPDYLAARAAARDPELFAYFNFASFYPTFQRIAGASEGDDSTALLKPSNQALLRGLGIETLGTISLGCGLGAEATRLQLSVTHRGERGLFKVLAYRDGPVQRPDWVPANWISADVSSFSFSDALREMLAMLGDINPIFAGMAQDQIRNLNRQLRIDIERDLVGNLGETVVIASSLPAGVSPDNVPPDDQLDRFVGISLADPEGFQRALDALKLVLGPGFEKSMAERDYLGRKLYSFTPPQSGRRGFTYSVADRWLLLGIGSATPVEAVLQSLDSGQPGFFARDEVRAALADVPGRAFNFQYADGPQMVSAFIAAAIAEQVDATGDELWIDPAARPSLETLARHFSHLYGYSVRRADGLHFEGSLVHPQP